MKNLLKWEEKESRPLRCKNQEQRLMHLSFEEKSIQLKIKI